MINDWWRALLLYLMMWCGRSLGFYVIAIPKGDDGYVKVIHFARDEIVLERSVRDFVKGLDDEHGV